MYRRLELADQVLGASFSSEDELFSQRADGAFFVGLDHPVSVYLVRHGRTEGNATMTFQGRLDYPLDKLGRSQARAAATWLAERGPELILTSPLRRASETAEILAAAAGLEPLPLSSLVEVDVGIFSGISAEAAAAAHPGIFAEFEYRSWDAVPGAEGSVAMYSRAMSTWRKIRELALGGAATLVCVTHGGFLQWLFRSTFGVRTWLPLVPTANCGISQYDIEPTAPGKPAFVQWTRVNFSAPAVEPGTKPVF